MRKKFSVLFIFMAIVLMMSFFFGNTQKTNAFADKQNQDEDLQSKSYILLDANSGTVIKSKNEKQRLPIASMCKIMTLLLCFESVDNGNLNLDEKICVSENASGMGGSQVFLESNAEYVASDLIKSIVVASANDACVAMAERLCGSEEEFVNKMNEKAKSLDMKDTNFVNCTGLPKNGQYSCALDVSTMFRSLISHEKYFEFSKIWMDEINHPNDRVTGISNTNKLIRHYKGCDGGKTGYTSEAGHCLCATAERNGMRLISVVIKSPDSKTRFKEVSDMFNYGFSNFVSKRIVDDKSPLKISVKIESGKKENISVVAEKPMFYFSAKNEKTDFEYDFKPLSKVKAPISVGDKVGILSVFKNGVCIGEVNVLSNENVEKKTYFDYLKDVTTNWAL